MQCGQPIRVLFDKSSYIGEWVKLKIKIKDTLAVIYTLLCRLYEGERGGGCSGANGVWQPTSQPFGHETLGETLP